MVAWFSRDIYDVCSTMVHSGCEGCHPAFDPSVHPPRRYAP
jgi:hypothetical protein